MNLMNFGCGSIQPERWTNVDRTFHETPHGKQIIADAATKPLPFDDGSFNGIVCSHSLQENDYDMLPVVLTDLRRILMPGGTLRVLWPNVAAAVAAWQRGDRDWFPVNAQEPGLDDAFCCYLNWFSTAKTLCTAPRLITLLTRAGFHDVRLAAFGESAHYGLAELDDREPEEQIIVEATR